MGDRPRLYRLRVVCALDPGWSVFGDPVKGQRDYAVVEEREIPQRKGVRRDQVIFFYKLAQAGVECFFRRVEYYDEEQDQILVFLTNHMKLAAATIAAVYKDRWAIEFFKALKQNLRVK